MHDGKDARSCPTCTARGSLPRRGPPRSSSLAELPTPREPSKAGPSKVFLTCGSLLPQPEFKVDAVVVGRVVAVDEVGFHAIEQDILGGDVLGKAIVDGMLGGVGGGLQALKQLGEHGFAGVLAHGCALPGIGIAAGNQVFVAGPGIVLVIVAGGKDRAVAPAVRNPVQQLGQLQGLAVLAAAVVKVGVGVKEDLPVLPPLEHRVGKDAHKAGLLVLGVGDVRGIREPPGAALQQVKAVAVVKQSDKLVAVGRDIGLIPHGFVHPMPDGQQVGQPPLHPLLNAEDVGRLVHHGLQQTAGAVGVDLVVQDVLAEHPQDVIGAGEQLAGQLHAGVAAALRGLLQQGEKGADGLRDAGGRAAPQLHTKGMRKQHAVVMLRDGVLDRVRGVRLVSPSSSSGARGGSASLTSSSRRPHSRQSRAFRLLASSSPSVPMAAGQTTRYCSSGRPFSVHCAKR